ncbi:MAG: sulfotransferase family protein [Bacteroidetes bacterium]|nr:sulfotransferase family protein [Bacteroidota bacterium]
MQKWIPARLIRQQEQLLCKWLYADDIPYTDPFFDETLAKCLSHPFNSKPFACVSAISELEMLADAVESVEPTAFIFHISRCGSTLLSQMLAIPSGSVSLAEVPFFDEILRSVSLTETEKDKALQAAIRLYGQKRKGNENQLFIKLDSWHVFFYDTFRRLYPHVPCVFLYRDPYDVLQSHRKHRGMQAVPGVIEPAVFGFTPDAISHLDQDAYTALVLERYLQVYLELREKSGPSLWFNYADGPANMIRGIAAMSGHHWSAEEMQQIGERSRYHSKHPAVAFKEILSHDQRPAYLGPATRYYEMLAQKLSSKA